MNNKTFIYSKNVFYKLLYLQIKLYESIENFEMTN